MSDWKPGDVAMVEMGHGPEIAIWTGELWAWSDGTGPYQGVSHCHRDRPARPLVVIDPEDREAVERLALGYIAAAEAATQPYGVGSVNVDAVVTEMQAALREFASPVPPIEEPTGLGAVVESVNGDLWVRIDSDGVWACASDEDKTATYWPTISVVRVLSEGVQP